MGGQPKESDESRRARQRERQSAARELDRASSETAMEYTNQLRSVYGKPSLFGFMR